jgi:PGF-CTERM protein
MMVKNDTQFVTKQIETSKFVGESGYAYPTPVPTTRSPGFGAPLVLVALGTLAVLAHLRRQKP